MRAWTGRHVLRILAVLANLVYIGLWMFQLVQLLQQGDMGPEAWRSALTYFAIMIAVPAISVLALLWPPIQK